MTSSSICQMARYFSSKMLVIPTAISNWRQAPFSVLEPVLSSPPMMGAIYMTAANYVYLARRAHLRRRRKREILRLRVVREPGVSWSLFSVFVVSWQLFVLFYPLVEPIASLFGFASFMYAYPNAHGVGFILEPVQTREGASVGDRTKSQIRLDWHRFSVNVGDIGRDGYRHPPTVEKNLPHLDIHRWGMKHWPWRRRHSVSRVRNGWHQPQQQRRIHIQHESKIGQTNSTAAVAKLGL